MPDDAAPADDAPWRRPAGSTPGETGRIVGMVVLQGVIADEATTYTSVLSQWPATQFVRIGRRTGRTAGAGGAIVVDARFDDVDLVDVLVVPGTIGAEASGTDARVARWLATQTRSADWVLASSTGTLVLAGCGLLRDRRATTHWLASARLTAHGTDPDIARSCRDGNLLTSRGLTGARETALWLTAHLFGTETARRIELGIPGAATAPTGPTAR